ncbi:MAG: DUF3575 domain-containing protein, partial [Bacteroidota bacterium]
MKAIKACLILLLMSMNIYSQESNIKPEDSDEIGSTNNKNEVRLNALLAVIGGIELSYERLLNEESSIGISAMVGYDDDVLNGIEYYISPYYRIYFGKKYAGGFFIEGFAMLNSVETNFSLFNTEEERNYVTDFGLGFGLGGKWILKDKIVLELNYGLGRNLFKNDETDIDIIGKAGAS